jgi:hypothetical protein
MTIFWRARCGVTGRELKFRTSRLYVTTTEEMAAWVAKTYRGLTLLEWAEWSDAEHGGVFYPVPVQNVKFDAPKPVLEMPDRRRVSLLISRIPRKKLLTA